MNTNQKSNSWEALSVIAPEKVTRIYQFEDTVWAKKVFSDEMLLTAVLILASLAPYFSFYTFLTLELSIAVLALSLASYLYASGRNFVIADFMPIPALISADLILKQHLHLPPYVSALIVFGLSLPFLFRATTHSLISTSIFLSYYCITQMLQTTDIAKDATQFKIAIILLAFAYASVMLFVKALKGESNITKGLRSCLVIIFFYLATYSKGTYDPSNIGQIKLDWLHYAFLLGNILIAGGIWTSLDHNYLQKSALSLVLLSFSANIILPSYVYVSEFNFAFIQICSFLSLAWFLALTKEKLLYYMALLMSGYFAYQCCYVLFKQSEKNQELLFLTAAGVILLCVSALKPKEV